MADWKRRLGEAREALESSTPYLLSHHAPRDYYRCYSIASFQVCARCAGIYPGILAGLLYSSTGQVLPLGLIALLPAPALVEKYFTGVKNRAGYNSARSLTGFLLGLGYVAGLVRLLRLFEPVLVLVGFFYVAAALVLLRLQGTTDLKPEA